MAQLDLFKTAAEGQVARPLDFNNNMTQIETNFNAHEGAGGTKHANATTGAAGFMSSVDKIKLDGVATGAEVNQQAFSGIAVSGQPTLTAGSKTQTFEIVAGDNITILVDNDTKQIQIIASGDISTNAAAVAVLDAAGLFTGTNAEAILAEIAGAGRTNETLKSLADLIALKAPLASPTFTGSSVLPVGFTVATPTAGDDSTKLSTTAFVEERVKRIPMATEKTASGTLALTDAGKLVSCSHASTQIDITVPPNSSVAFPVGTTIVILRSNVADVALVAGSGVTLLSSDSYKKINKTYESATLIKTATDTWILSGSLKA
jgi:hypothetical protein